MTYHLLSMFRVARGSRNGERRCSSCLVALPSSFILRDLLFVLVCVFVVVCPMQFSTLPYVYTSS
jgi:hypothetical protein